MIIMPTSELIGGFADVLPQITDEKSDDSGVLIRWDGWVLHFATYDVYSGAEVLWQSGQGDESSEDGPKGEQLPDYVEWGSDDDPWATWITVAAAKEISKTFRLPGKLWRWPVNIKCSPTGDRLTIEREDGPRLGRVLTVPADPGKVSQVPDVRAIAYDEGRFLSGSDVLDVAPYRIAAFGAGRSHGVLRLIPGGPDQPIGVTMGSRFAGFLYRSDAKGVHRYNVLRDGSGLHTSRTVEADLDAAYGGRDD